MSTILAITLILSAFCAASGIIWFIFSGWRKHQIDLTRQNLFRIRNKLFDAAATGKLDFNEEAYGLTRSVLNGGIRFLEDLSFFRFVWFIIFSSRVAKSSVVLKSIEKREAAIQKLPQEKRELYESSLHEFHFAILFYIAKSCLPIYLILWIVAKTSAAKDALHPIIVKPFVQNRLKVFDAEAALMSPA